MASFCDGCGELTDTIDTDMHTLCEGCYLLEREQLELENIKDKEVK